MIDDLSTSICTFLELGAKAFNLPVTLSSNRAPTLSITSQLCIAKFASYVPCIPSIPKKFLFVFGTQPKPIRVSVTGQSNIFTNSVKSLDAFGPELTTPPPAYIIGRSACNSNFATLLIKSSSIFD